MGENEHKEGQGQMNRNLYKNPYSLDELMKIERKARRRELVQGFVQTGLALLFFIVGGAVAAYCLLMWLTEPSLNGTY